VAHLEKIPPTNIVPFSTKKNQSMQEPTQLRFHRQHLQRVRSQYSSLPTAYTRLISCNSKLQVWAITIFCKGLISAFYCLGKKEEQRFGSLHFCNSNELGNWHLSIPFLGLVHSQIITLKIVAAECWVISSGPPRGVYSLKSSFHGCRFAAKSKDPAIFFAICRTQLTKS